MECGLFLAEGEKLVLEAINAGLSCQSLFARRSWYDHHTLPATISEPDCLWLSDSDMDRVSHLSSPPPLAGIFQIRRIPMPPYRQGDGSIWLYLDRIRDAGNLGTLLRIADWFGVSGVWCAPGTADPWNAKCIQASMGSAFRVAVAEGEADVCMDYLKGIRMYAAVLQGTPLASIDFGEGGLLLLGNESDGLQPGLIERATAGVCIPGRGRAESLNAAVAGGIILSWMRK